MFQLDREALDIGFELNYDPAVITVKHCDKKGGAQGDFAVLVVLEDDSFPHLEAEFLLEPGAAWMRGNVLEVMSFSLRARPSSGDIERINSSLLKLVPFGRWIAVAVGAAGDLVNDTDEGFWSIPNPLTKKPSIRLSDAGPDYEGVARLYRIYLRTSERSPAEEIAKDFGVSTAQAQQWIARSRYMGFLSPIAPRRRRQARWTSGQDKEDS